MRDDRPAGALAQLPAVRCAALAGSAVGDSMNLTILERVQLVKDVVLAICGALTAGIALYGLKTWQRQLAGTTQFELARRALLAVYKVRDALTVARSPAVHPAEYVSRPDREEAGSSRDDKDEQVHGTKAGSVLCAQGGRS